MCERIIASHGARLYRFLFDHADDGVFVFDLDGCCVAVNQRAAGMLGCRVEDLVGRSVTEIVAPDERADVAAKRQVLLAGQDVRLHERTLCAQDGTFVPVEVSLTLVRDDQERPLYIHGLVRDISERKRVEKMHIRLAAALEQTAEAIVILDDAAIIQYVNPAFEQVTGYTRQEAIGKPPQMIESGESDAAFFRDMWYALAHGESWAGHLAGKRKDGSDYQAQVTISPVQDAAGQVINYIIVQRDVTRRARLESQLRQAQKMEAVGQLAGGIAHDFNNHLTAILGYAELLLDDPALPEAVRSDLDEIRRAAQRSASLTQQLLIFSRKQVVQPQILDLNTIIPDMEKMLRRLIGEDIELAAVLDPDLGLVKAGVVQIEQIVMNLVVNARDAMPDGGQVTIETANVELDENYAQIHAGVVPGHYVMLSVSDNGIGMDQEVKAHIFEPFFTTKGEGKGTGLGLATVYGIVEQCGGHIQVYSEPGHGTTFKIYLPRRFGNKQGRRQDRVLVSSVQGHETILLVEDDVAVRKLARQILERYGYDVLEAGYALEALRLSKQHTGVIHLLMTDVIMPGGMNGVELAGYLARLRPEIRVLYMSGYTGQAIARHGMLQPGVNLLPKPFTAVTLARQVRRVLDAPVTAVAGR